MKKFLSLIVAAMLVGTLVSGCGTSSDSSTETSVDESTETTEDDYADDSSLDESGTVAEVDGDLVTLQLENGSQLSFDISESENSGMDYLMQGALADVTYEVADDGSYMAVYFDVTMSIEQQANTEDRDPIIYGTLEYMDANDVYLIDDTGTERDFENQMSRTISFETIQAGDRIAVAYYGTIFEDPTDPGAEYDAGTFTDKPVALKVMSIDAVNTEDALANYISGIVSMVYTNGIEIQNDLTTFRFQADPSLVEDIEQEDHVRVYYEGQFGGIAMTATDVEVEE